MSSNLSYVYDSFPSSTTTLSPKLMLVNFHIVVFILAQPDRAMVKLGRDHADGVDPIGRTITHGKSQGLIHDQQQQSQEGDSQPQVRTRYPSWIKTHVNL